MSGSRWDLNPVTPLPLAYDLANPHLIHFFNFIIICLCDGMTGLVSLHGPVIGASAHLIPRPGRMMDIALQRAGSDWMQVIYPVTDCTIQYVAAFREHNS